MTDQLTDNPQTWPILKKILVLFTSSYFFFYMFPFPFNELPYIGEALAYYNKFIDFITVLAGKHLVGISSFEKIEENGSGDTLFDYVKLVTTLLLSITVTCIVFIFMRKQKNYNTFYTWILIYARYYAGIYMIQYGVAKLHEQQFVFPGVGTLEQTYGSSSPMGLLWNFMGYSRTYTTFTGIFEVITGVFLLFRKTTALGCLLGITIMTNVVLLNFCYDVPVKLFASHLVLILLFILSPNIKRLFNFFVLNKVTEIKIYQLILPKRWMRITRIASKIIVIIGSLIVLYYDEFSYLDTMPQPTKALNGTYKTKLFVTNKDTLPPLTTDTTRWNKMLIQDGMLKIVTMADKSVYFSTEIDTVKNTLTITSFSDSTQRYTLMYEKLPDNCFSFSGVYNKDSVYVFCKRKTVADYNLVKTPFKWINEYPNNK